MVKPIELSNVKSVYSGQPNTCYCGCAGKYYYAGAYKVQAGEERGYVVDNEEVSDCMVKKVVKYVNEHLDSAELYDDLYVTVPASKTREYTVYLKEAC